MTPSLTLVITAMGVLRIVIGLAPFVAAGLTSRLLGFPADHDTPTARLMARFFGVRDIGLGVLAFYGLSQAAALSFVLLFNAAMDAGDLVSTAIPLLRRQGIDRAAILSALMATTGGLSWVVVWLLLR